MSSLRLHPAPSPRQQTPTQTPTNTPGYHTNTPRTPLTRPRTPQAPHPTKLNRLHPSPLTHPPNVNTRPLSIPPNPTTRYATATYNPSTKPDTAKFPFPKCPGSAPHPPKRKKRKVITRYATTTYDLNYATLPRNATVTTSHQPITSLESPRRSTLLTTGTTPRPVESVCQSPTRLNVSRNATGYRVCGEVSMQEW